MPIRWNRMTRFLAQAAKRVRTEEYGMEDFGEPTTGTRDEHYNLISVRYHALHGTDNCDHYAMDAESSVTSGWVPSSERLRRRRCTSLSEASNYWASSSPPEFDTPPASTHRRPPLRASRAAQLRMGHSSRRGEGTEDAHLIKGVRYGGLREVQESARRYL
jgi:hypothetical protein